MSANPFAKAMGDRNGFPGLRDNEIIWFPKWIYRYASHVGVSRSQPLNVRPDAVIRFLRTLRDNAVPVWADENASLDSANVIFMTRMRKRDR